MLFPGEDHLSWSQFSSVNCNSFCKFDAPWAFPCPFWHVHWSQTCLVRACVVMLVKLFGLWNFYSLFNHIDSIFSHPTSSPSILYICVPFFLAFSSIDSNLCCPDILEYVVFCYTIVFLPEKILLNQTASPRC